MKISGRAVQFLVVEEHLVVAHLLAQVAMSCMESRSKDVLALGMVAKALVVA
jgi:hypothetical protein